MRPPRILLADDHRLLCEAFTKLLEPHCEVLGTFNDGRALLAAAKKLSPDIVVLDIAMPLLNGLDTARQLHEAMPAVKIIFLTMNEDPDLVAEYCKNARMRGLKVIIAGAGLAAALPGVAAAHTDLPVIGVPTAVPTSPKPPRTKCVAA